jgi:hypothetical protein
MGGTCQSLAWPVLWGLLGSVFCQRVNNMAIVAAGPQGGVNSPLLLQPGSCMCHCNSGRLFWFDCEGSEGSYCPGRLLFSVGVMFLPRGSSTSSVESWVCMV